MRRSESNKYRPPFKPDTSTQKFVQNYDYLPKQSISHYNATPSRGNDSSFQQGENNRSIQMNLIQSKRSKIDEMKMENISLSKNKMNNLLSSLKSELGKISKHIKDTDSKVDDYLHKNTNGDYLSQKMSKKVYNYDYTSTSELQSTSQKSIPYSNSMSNIPLKSEGVNQFLKGNKRNEREYASMIHMNPLLTKYKSPYAHDSFFIAVNAQNDKSFTYQYELQPGDYSFDHAKYSTVLQPNPLQDKLIALEGKLENANKVISELDAKEKYFEQCCESMKRDKENDEYQCSKLKNEFIEAKKRLLDEIEMKNNYLAMNNKSAGTIEKNEKALNDYENQVRALQKALKEKEEELRRNVESYRNDVKDLLKEKEALKTTVLQLKKSGSSSNEARSSMKDAELVELKSINEELKMTIKSINEANAIEKNEMMNQMIQMNSAQEKLSSQNSIVIDENQGLKEEITKLQEEIKGYQSYPKQVSNEAREAEEAQEQYEALLVENKRYQMEISIQKDQYVTQIANLTENNNQFKLDSERKNAQIKALSSELNNKKAEIGALEKEEAFLKEQYDSNKLHLATINFNKEKINELTEENEQLKAKLKNSEEKSRESFLREKVTEQSEMKDIIHKLKADIEVYQAEYAKAKERNDMDNEQMHNEFTAEMNKANESIESLKKANIELKAQYDDQVIFNRKQSEELRALNAEATSLRDSDKSYQSQCLCLKDELNLIDKQFKDKENELKKEKDNFQKRLQASSQEVEDLKTELKSIKGKEISSQAEITVHLQTISRLNENITKITKDNDNKNELISSLTIANDKLNADLNEMKEKESILELKSTDLIAEHNKKTASIEAETLKERQHLIDEARILKEEIQLLKANEITLQQQNEFQFKSIQQFQESSKENKVLITNFTTQEATISNLTNDINTLTIERNEANSKMAQCQHLLEENDKRITALTEENHQMSIEVAKVKALEIQNQKLKAENLSTFNQLKAQTDSNKDLLSQLQTQKEEIEQLLAQQQAKNNEQVIEVKSDSFPEDLIGSYSSKQHQEEEVDNLYKTIDQCKETILSLQSLLEKKTAEIGTIAEEKQYLENELIETKQEVEQFKIINDKLIQANSSLKESKEGSAQYRQSLTKAEDIKEEDIEILHFTIANLRDLVNEKDQEITALQQKHIEAEAEGGNKQTDSSLSKIGSMQLTDAEKCLKYQSRLEQYKIQQKSDQEQIIFLKSEIKDLKAQIDKLKSFEGRISSYDEFIKLYLIAIENYKPKRKEQEEALKKIEEHLSLHEIEDQASSRKHKKGLFDKLFK